MSQNPYRARREHKGPSVIVMIPQVGNIVHWQPFHKTAPTAAIITAVHHGEPTPENRVPYVDLTLFMDDGTTKHQPSAAWSQRPSEGHWNWMANA